MKKIKKYLDLAFYFAEKAFQEDEVPVGAVVLSKDHEILGIGYNRKEQNQDSCDHAEIIAMKEAAKNLRQWRLSEAMLFVTLEPCILCFAAIQQFRMKKVFYSAVDKKGGAISLGYWIHQDQRLNHEFEAIFVEDLKASSILKNFFALKRQKT